MAGDDRLSALGDDLLRRILYFVPTKEAASTSVLSRRWGSLWRSSGAVNLAVRIHNNEEKCIDYIDYHRDYSYTVERRRQAEEAFFSRRDAFVLAAKAALDAATHVTRLTFRLEADRDQSLIERFLTRCRDWKFNVDVIGDVISHPAARRLEEFRVTAGAVNAFPFQREVYTNVGSYRIHSLSSSETLRVLDLTKCNGLATPSAATFPRLATLRLRLCTMEPKDLQALLDAAPELTTVQLESVFFPAPQTPAGLPHQVGYFGVFSHSTPKVEAPAVVRLCCLAATVLELVLCALESQQSGGDRGTIEIDAPRLRSFRYKGIMRPFLLRSPAPDMAQVDLHFLHDTDELRDHALRNNDKDTTRVLFWQFVQNFTSAKALKLKVNNLKDIAVKGKARQIKLLSAFPNVDRLELEGMHDAASKTAAVAIANLLHCCPVVCDLWFKLSTVPSDTFKESTYGSEFLERKDRLDYDKSVNHFACHRSKAMISLEDGSMDKYDEVSDIPGLSGRSFTCLQNSLRRVALQFRLDKSSFGVRLIKFFAGNAMVLEEMCLDSGNRRLCEHMNLNIEKWIAPSNACFKRKSLTESSWEFSKIPRTTLDSTVDLANSTTGFTVLPLQRK
ncbi:hypothetical protein ACP70R_035225 [Stipagrostis hirtigluma subsp. patula]